MFNFFKKQAKQPRLPQLYDLNNHPIHPGDKVRSLRYELGLCELLERNGQYFYRSIASGQEVSWVKMIDAVTERQKVFKAENP